MNSGAQPATAAANKSRPLSALMKPKDITTDIAIHQRTIASLENQLRTRKMSSTQRRDMMLVKQKYTQSLQQLLHQKQQQERFQGIKSRSSAVTAFQSGGNNSAARRRQQSTIAAQAAAAAQQQRSAQVKNRFRSAAQTAGTTKVAGNAFSQEGTMLAQRRAKEERQMQAAIALGQQQTARETIRDTEIARQERIAETAAYDQERSKQLNRMGKMQPYADTQSGITASVTSPAEQKKVMAQISRLEGYIAQTKDKKAMNNMFDQRRKLYNSIGQKPPYYDFTAMKARAQQQETAAYNQEQAKQLKRIGKMQPYADAAQPQVTMTQNPILQKQAEQQLSDVNVKLVYATPKERGELYKQRNVLYAQLGQKPPRYNPALYTAQADAQRR